MVDQEDKATDIANTRIPYASTLVQTQGGPERFTYGIAEQEEEEHENLNLESTIDEIPNNFSFVHISNPEDQDEELVKIEDSSRKVPLNFRFWEILMPHASILKPIFKWKHQMFASKVNSIRNEKQIT